MSKILQHAKALKMDAALIKSKFRGALLGSLVGDCLGAPYEGDHITCGEKIIIQRYFDQLEDPDLKGPKRNYTDDTAMMKSLVESLADNPEINYKHIATLFVKEYFKEPRRGYGQGIVDVFKKLRKSKFDDIFKPAQEQFGGSGSFGNGGAMRIAPIALYFHSSYENMVEAARKTTQLTHTNSLGVHGAILQAIAVHQAFHTSPSDKIDPQLFCQQLIDKIKPIEAENDDGLDLDDSSPYQHKIKTIQKLLKTKYFEEMDEDVIADLGNSVTAYESVPTAIYCFLRALQNDISTVESESVFRRSIQYAITLGGDTDTIACMAGAIAGAYQGESGINENLLNQCEFHTELTELSDKLFEAASKE